MCEHFRAEGHCTWAFYPVKSKLFEGLPDAIAWMPAEALSLSFFFDGSFIFFLGNSASAPSCTGSGYPKHLILKSIAVVFVI